MTVHDHTETPSAITLKPASTIAEMRKQPGSINHHDGGRGVYWNDPDGHYLEIITRPYGGVGTTSGL